MKIREKLYSVTMTERELVLFSEFQKEFTNYEQFKRMKEAGLNKKDIKSLGKSRAKEKKEIFYDINGLEGEDIGAFDNTEVENVGNNRLRCRLIYDDDAKNLEDARVRTSGNNICKSHEPSIPSKVLKKDIKKRSKYDTI